MLISNRTARLLGAGALLLAAPALASCTEQATDHIYTPAAGTNHRDAAVDVLDAVIVANDDQPGKGTLVFTVVNNKVDAVGSTKDVTDKLTGVSGDVTGMLKKPVAIAPGGHVTLATSTVDIPNGVGGIPVTGNFSLGDVVDVEFDFANAGAVTLGVPVVHNSEGGQWAGQNGAPDAAVPMHGETVEEMQKNSHESSSTEGDGN
ncbi:hypothetical protein GCM10011584_28540 [Nocardioides phosphati]|uniref:Copper chaperone PCu(A)C n=1 Tax=Nocardioides phosphati TaxID=1867775 RepID=A0ABQ2NC52_9ACTN|nr:hypothetical protein [Nocardioides phosphati]GGO92347.1 hypothetical protein GCM10011584_28540 [Nocardioides phosphati]